MSDKLTPAERSQLMAKIKSRNTKPEVRVRQVLHGLGYRFRIHVKDLPGQPDVVFPKRRKIIFVMGAIGTVIIVRQALIDPRVIMIIGKTNLLRIEREIKGTRLS
jgi:DNA mismatch endonuclease Vsr